ncbi:MAG: Fpg/Nei family DNA glycosylase [Verrucomicrobia bacterium]|nr:Fpg/Nei family DNA glycosylase [Verrucomicrobiota bacterium]
MPELAEVEFFRRQWNPGLRKKIRLIHIHRGKRVFRGVSPSTLIRQIQGKTMISSEAHGKQMLFRFGRDGWLGIHLGMTGKLLARSRSFSPGSHDHLVLRTGQCSLVYQDPRLFGRIRFQTSREPPEWWNRIPPAILSPGFNLPQMASFCQRRGRTPLKALLLRQDSFPGIGNWMADEILWQARLHPKRKAGKLGCGEIQRLHFCIKKISRVAMQTIGRDGSDPPASWLFLYRWRSGGRCPRCKKTLARGSVGGRTSCWCPQCQPALPRRKHSA